MQQEVWQDGTGIYLKILGEGEENYADRIFQYQEIVGFLPLDITWINGQKEYVYDISGKISLAQYLAERKVSKEELKELLRQVMKLSDYAQEYLLDGNGVVYREDCIFVDSRSGQVSGIYQENTPDGGVGALGSLVEFIMKKMDAHNEEMMFWVYGFHKQTKEAGMTRQILWKYLEKDENKKEKCNEKKCLETSVKSDMNIKKVEKRIVTNHQKKSYLLPITLLVSGVFVTIVTWLLGCFREPLSQENDLTMGVGASIFFLGVTGYGAWKTRPKCHLSEVIWQEDEKVRKLCLISCQGRIESIPITYYPFVLGMDETKVDGMVGGLGIDRIHAQIICEGSEFYVMDEESQQGTFHNDDRLVPWQKRRLQDGDILRLAQTEYVVEIS